MLLSDDCCVAVFVAVAAAVDLHVIGLLDQVHKNPDAVDRHIIIGLEADPTTPAFTTGSGRDGYATLCEYDRRSFRMCR